MNTLSYKTVSANTATAKKEWVVVDAQDQVVGRFSSIVAKMLRGKYKTNFTPHADCGDNVIIINAEKVKFTGAKEEDKTYVRHTGYPGGQRFTSPKELLAKHPERILEMAIRRMLPKTKLGVAIYKNLHVYAGANHPHEAQQPKQVNINNIK